MGDQVRRVYYANALIDVPLPGVGIVPTPCERRGADGRLLLFPMPQVALEQKTPLPGTPPRRVSFLNEQWFVNDPLASTLPVTCHSQDVARLLADTWSTAGHGGAVDAALPDQVQRWCWWFAKSHPEGTEYAPLHERPAVRPANSVEETPPSWPENEPGIQPGQHIDDDAAPEAPGEDQA